MAFALGDRARTKPPATAYAPPVLSDDSTEGRLIYAVGDVHGQLELLRGLVDSIIEDSLRSEPEVRPLLIFLGDYIDRGESSRSIIELLNRLRENPAFEVRTLKGNHEDELLLFLRDPNRGPRWSEFGGDATLLSYGVVPPSVPDPDQWMRARDALQQNMPEAHLAFLESLELMISIGDYLFVHAGIKPGVVVEAQAPHDLLWIRREFLDSGASCGQIVVHGHNSATDVQVFPHRIGIDTGAYATGVLTAIRLSGDCRHTLQARYDRT